MSKNTKQGFKLSEIGTVTGKEEVKVSVSSQTVEDRMELQVRAIQALVENLSRTIDAEMKEGDTSEIWNRADKMKKRIQRSVRLIGKM